MGSGCTRYLPRARWHSVATCCLLAMLLASGVTQPALAAAADQGPSRKDILGDTPVPLAIPLTVAGEPTAAGLLLRLQIANLSTDLTTLTLRFRDRQAQDLRLPVVTRAGDGSDVSRGLVSSVTLAVRGWSSTEARATVSASGRTGWVEITAAPDVPVAVSAVLTQTLPDGRSTAVEAGAIEAYQQAWLLADQRENRSTSLHLVSLDPENDQAVKLVFRGAENECETTANLVAKGMAVVSIGESLPCSAGSLGPVEIQGAAGFAGVGRIDLESGGLALVRSLTGIRNPERLASPLEFWTVADGTVQFDYLQSAQCLDLRDVMLVGTSYTVHASGWQWRASETDEWEYVPGTNRTGQLCAYSPTDPGEYRAVADVSIDGVRALYASAGVVRKEAAGPPLQPTAPSPPASGEFQSQFSGTFVSVPPGEFVMGSTSEQARNDEQPLTTVKITKGFQIGKYELTLEEWELIMGTNVYSNDECGRNCPVVAVAFSDVEKYLERINQRDTEFNYRLPTEAEWEYAARAGATGDHYGELDEIAWYRGNSSPDGQPIGQKKPNAWGLHDMLGSVFEWTQTNYGPYPGGTVSDPVGPESGSRRVARGGSFLRGPEESRLSARGTFNWGSRLFHLGFRLVRTPK